MFEGIDRRQSTGFPYRLCDTTLITVAKLLSHYRSMSSVRIF
jgi:hypothetical protein